MLALPFDEGHFTSVSDAGIVQIHCALLQDQPDTTKQLFGYWLCSLTKAKQTYDTTQQECLAIV